MSFISFKFKDLNFAFKHLPLLTNNLSFTDGNKNFLTVCADVVNELEFDSVEDIIKA